jgi:parallel beta-helix repeat protein
MSGRATKVVFIALFIAISLISISPPMSIRNNVCADTLNVGGSGSGNYTSIQDAIDDAYDGDTIYIYSGTYYENIVVNKSISLLGNYSEAPIIDGSGIGDVISIEADWVNISGLTLIGGESGILLENVNNCNVHNSDVMGNGNGIVLESSHENIIFFNSVTGNTVRGIYLEDSMKNEIKHNIAFTNKYGIELFSSNENILLRNNISSNFRDGILMDSSSNNHLDGNTMTYNGIYLEGNLLEHWNTHYIDTSNSVNGKPVYYWKDQDGGTIPLGAGQVILANCTNIKVEDQELTKGSVGIQLGFSLDNEIINNNVSNNWIGIDLVFSGRNSIMDNMILSNNNEGISLMFSSGNDISGNEASFNDDGIYLDSSNSNNITDNVLSSNDAGGVNLLNSNLNDIKETSVSNNDNGFYLWKSNLNNIMNSTVFSNTEYGILLEDSLNNAIHHNDFVNNQEQAHDDSNNGNQWNTSYPDGGNFWSNYDGVDVLSGSDQDLAGSDGIGDTPFTIEEGSNNDYYPLIEALYMDVVNPSVISTYPADEATDVNLSTEITVVFSESMDVVSVESSIFILPDTNHSFLWNNSNKTLTIDFSDLLSHETIYLISITINAKDLAGNSLENLYEFRFTTVAEPVVEPEKEEDDSSIPLNLLVTIIVIAIIIVIIILVLVKKKKGP